MEKKRYPLSVRREVEKLRGAGKMYSEIQKIYPIPKSTLSAWLGEKYPDIFDREKHLKRIRIIAARVRKNDRIKRDQIYEVRGKEMAKSIANADVYYLKSLLAMLYWAEGSKFDGVSGLILANTDPRLLLLYITMLRKCYVVDEKRLRVRLHLHYYHPRRKTIKFWSELLGVPEKQFGKLYIKNRSKTKKFRRNFMGICVIKYLDSSIRKELLGFAYAIQEKIAGALPSSFNG